MSKSADAFRTISEVAEWLDTPAHVLRFWESKFTQVKPVKRAGGRRYYRPADMRLLGGIKKLLHEDGMTIKGAQKVLREQGIKHVSSLCTLSLGDEDGIIEGAMQSDVMPEPVDTVVPFSKPESETEAEDEADIVAAEPDTDLLSDIAEPVTEDAPEPIDPPQRSLSVSDLDVPGTPKVDVTSEPVEDPAPAAEAETETAILQDTAEAEAEAPAQRDVPADPNLADTADSLPAFLQHSMAERSAETQPETESPETPAAPTPEAEPEEPLPGALSHLAKLTHLSPEAARQIRPVFEQLSAATR